MCLHSLSEIFDYFHYHSFLLWIAYFHFTYLFFWAFILFPLWDILLYCFILSNFLWLQFLFHRLQGHSSSCRHPLVKESVQEACADFLMRRTTSCLLVGEARYCLSGGQAHAQEDFKQPFC